MVTRFYRWSFMVSYLEDRRTQDGEPPLNAEQCTAVQTASSEEVASIEKASGDKPASIKRVSEEPSYTAPGGRTRRWRQRLRSASRTVLQLLTPPTYAAILSIIIAAITPLQVSVLTVRKSLLHTRTHSGSSIGPSL